ncbi:hypothetical protein [Sphingobacterium spiritivorum]
MMNLAKNTAQAMVQMAKYTPQMLEDRFDAYRQLLETLDTIDRSLRYFYEYEGKDKARNILKLKRLSTHFNELLNQYTAPQTLAVLARQNNEAAIDHIVMMIMYIKMFFMVDRSITKEASFQVAHIILSEFPYLTLEEISICFNNGIKGYYGADYQRLDGPSLIKWIQQYARERQLRIAEKQYAREVQYKSESETGRTQKGDSLQSFLKKATGASIIYNEIKGKK